MESLLIRLTQFFDPTLTAEKFDEILESLTNGNKSTDTEVISLQDLNLVKNATGVATSDLINILNDICSECRNIKEMERHSQKNDSWEYLSKTVNIEQMLIFYRCLIELAFINVNDLTNLRLAILSGRSYLLINATPGSKAFGVFQTDLIQRTFHLLDTINKIGKMYGNLRNSTLYITYFLLLEDIIILLRDVSFEEHENLKIELFNELANIIEFNHATGFRNPNAGLTYEKCYEIIETFCTPAQGDILDNMYMILNCFGRLNKFQKPIHWQCTNIKYESISNWFVNMLDKLPGETCEIMNRFIEAILTDTSLSCGTEQLTRNLDICVKYDSAMFRICNESIVKFLENLKLSSDTLHRCNCADIVSRMLLVDSECNWGIFDNEVSQIPREIYLVNVLVNKMCDANNNVKMKSLNGFMAVTRDGNKKIKEILKYLLFDNVNKNQPPIQKPQNITIHQEDNFQPSSTELTDEAMVTEPALDKNNLQPDETIPGIEQLNDIQTKLPRIVRINFSNKSALLKKATFALLEYIASTNINQIENLLISREFIKLQTDQSTLVRRQLVNSIDKILSYHQNNDNIMSVYVKITLGLSNDTDPKVLEVVMESLKRTIFNNIDRYEQSSSNKQLYPWILLNKMICSRNTLDLRSFIAKWIGSNLITQRTLSNIETYIGTGHSRIAWILLANISPKIVSNNPEFIVTELLKNLEDDMTNPNDITYAQLEILKYWCPKLSSKTKQNAFDKFTNFLMNGCVSDKHVERLFDICVNIILESSMKPANKSENAAKAANQIADRKVIEWCQQIHQKSEDYILQHKKTLRKSDQLDEYLVNYLFIYTQTTSELPNPAKVNIIAFLITFLNDVIGGKIQYSKDSTLLQKVNAIQNILIRLAVFNQSISGEIVPVIGQLLNTTGQPDVIKTSISCLGDICKKQTAVVQSILPYILCKTQHQYYSVRQMAIKMISDLIFDDYLKFRGSLLMYILAATNDVKPEISLLAIEILHKHCKEKSNTLIRCCMFECPFAFNGYTNFLNFGLFNAKDVCLDSPLIGADKQCQRYSIYKFFILHTDIIYCYLYFEYINLILEKIKSDDTIKMPNGIQGIRDFLYICEHICKLKKKKILKTNDDSNNLDNNDEDDDNDGGNLIATTTANNLNLKPVENKRSKGSKNTPTMEQVTIVVEKSIPLFAELNNKLCAIDKLFSNEMDSLCTAICEHFDTIVEYAKPRIFWEKYKNKAKSSAKK